MIKIFFTFTAAFTESWKSLAANQLKWREALTKHLKSGEEKLTQAATERWVGRKQNTFCACYNFVWLINLHIRSSYLSFVARYPIYSRGSVTVTASTDQKQGTDAASATETVTSASASTATDTGVPAKQTTRMLPMVNPDCWRPTCIHSRDLRKPRRPAKIAG